MSQKSPFNSVTATSTERHFGIDHLHANLGGRTARGGAVMIASNSLKFVLSMVGTAILARLLTPQDYGLIGMVAIFINFVSMFKDLGLSTATVQKAEINNAQISTLFWLNLALSGVVTVVAVLVAPLVSWFYGEPRLMAITVITSIGFIFGGLVVQHEALLKRQMRFFALSAISVISMVIGYAVGILLAWRGFSYWSLVYSQLALALTNTGGVWLLSRWRPGLPRRRSGIRSMVTFGGNLTGFATLNYFSRNLDNLLIGRVWGAQQLGFYNRAYQLMMLPIDQVNEPITSVAIPALSRIVDSPERYRQAYLRMLEKVVMLTMPCVAVMLATSDWLISVILGPQWSESGPIFLFLGITGLFQPMANTTGWLLLTQGRSHDMLRWGFMSAPITVLSIVAGLPWGAVGVAASYALSRVFIADPLLYWFVGRKGPVRASDFYRTIAPHACATLCALLVAFALRYWGDLHNPMIGIAVTAVGMIATTLLVLAALPAGRLALADIRNSLRLLRDRSSESVAQP